jgi:peptidoglycan/xylan/chitin deacetylase (PgdA/CDA1 family)
MTLPREHLEYPNRRYGMDHDRYAWSILPRRKPIDWPNSARIALWIVPALEWFPLDMKGKPFKAPGGMVTAYPDLRHYTLRDYGNRVGIFRLMNTLKERGLVASAAVNGAVAMRYPSLVAKVDALRWELIAHGRDMDSLHYGGLPEETEVELVGTTLRQLRSAAAKPIRGWLSPARSESFATPDIVAAAGLSYLCDWANDDMPYTMRCASGTLHCMPHSPDIDDFTILIQNHHGEEEFCQQITDQFDCLYDEADRFGGRLMSISLHPWIIGQPYRLGALEKALDHMLRRGSVWCATGGEILDAWIAQQ